MASFSSVVDNGDALARFLDQYELKGDLRASLVASRTASKMRSGITERCGR